MILTEPSTPLNDADHVGSFNFKEKTTWVIGIGNNRMFGVLLCMKQILKNDIHWNLYIAQMEMLIKKYEKVDIKTMGFPENWKELLEQK